MSASDTPAISAPVARKFPAGNWIAAAFSGLLMLVGGIAISTVGMAYAANNVEDQLAIAGVQHSLLVEGKDPGIPVSWPGLLVAAVGFLLLVVSLAVLVNARLQARHARFTAES